MTAPTIGPLEMSIDILSGKCSERRMRLVILHLFPRLDFLYPQHVVSNLAKFRGYGMISLRSKALGRGKGSLFVVLVHMWPGTCFTLMEEFFVSGHIFGTK